MIGQKGTFNRSRTADRTRNKKKKKKGPNKKCRKDINVKDKNA